MLKLEVIGNLGADAEIKDFQGNKFVTFRVAHTSRYKTQGGEERESTTWVDVTFNNIESKVIPFLKQGVRVFVRGNASLRVYSSPKLRQMVAGVSISAAEIELCGGQQENVPKQLISPEDGILYDVTKYYHVNAPIKGMKSDDVRLLIDTHGKCYQYNKNGWVAPKQEETAGQDNDSQVQNSENQQ